MTKKGGRYGKYGEQKRRERFQQKRLTECKFQPKPSPMEKWRGKKDKLLLPAISLIFYPGQGFFTKHY